MQSFIHSAVWTVDLGSTVSFSDQVSGKGLIAGAFLCIFSSKIASGGDAVVYYYAFPDSG